MRHNALAVLCFLAAVGAFAVVVRSTSPVPTMLFVNGRIYTLDKQNSVAEALAVRDGIVVAVGSAAELRSRYASAAEVDLAGNTVLPGFVDGHCHVLGQGSFLHNLNLNGTGSAHEIATLVAARLASGGRGSWLIGRGWDQNDWQVKNFPLASVLDSIAPSTPVLLTRVDGHALWVNSRAMQIAGVTGETPDPDGGKIYRDLAGNPSGVFVDNAMDLITRAVPPLSDTEITERLKKALDQCASLGLTEVFDMGVDTSVITAYKRLNANGQCPIRVYAAIGGTGGTWDQYLRSGPEPSPDNMLTVRALKLYIDGALGSRGAALFEPYSDDPGNRGLTVTSESDLELACRQALSHGFQVCVHAIGDRGNDIVLNVYEKVLASRPPQDPPPRWRIEHAQVVSLSDIPRFARLGVIPSMQPTHATSDMPWAETRVGPDRIKGAYAWRRFLESGSVIVGGSDFPVESDNPLLGFYAAITRADRDGNPPGGWYPDQKMTREEAARCYSLWAAYGGFQEEWKGTIEPGKCADLTVFGRDIMKIEPKEILTTPVAMTVVGGRIVYRRPASL